jgi:hypothetical protein
MTDNTEKSYFDLHITGIGYLNRYREVKPPRGGDSFSAVEIAALHGEKSQVQKTRFDCKVSGGEAKQILRDLKIHLDADKHVLVKFKLSDLSPETFTYAKGEKKGQTGVSLKARLLCIDWAQIDGQYVIRPKANDPEPDREAA